MTRMKTSQTLTSADRNLFGVIVEQETGNGFLSVSRLMEAYEIARTEYEWSERNLTEVMSGRTFLERLYHILLERGLVKVEMSSFTEEVENHGIARYLKSKSLWQTKGRGANKCTMCDPYVWIMIALELNPMIYAKVVIWLTDTLLFDRMEAGGGYLPMNAALDSVLGSTRYWIIAQEINKKVFGFHRTGMRNSATVEEVKAIETIQQRVENAVEFGVIHTEIDALKVIYSTRL